MTSSRGCFAKLVCDGDKKQCRWVGQVFFFLITSFLLILERREEGDRERERDRRKREGEREKKRERGEKFAPVCTPGRH